MALKTEESQQKESIPLELSNQEIVFRFLEMSSVFNDKPTGIVNNLYTRQFEIKQIDLFDFLSDAYPHIRVSYDLAAGELLNRMKEYEEVTLFDIGIGKGRQAGSLVTRLQEFGRVRKITVIGLDPDRSNLQDSEIYLKSSLTDTGVELNYIPLCGLIENLTEKDWGLFAGLNGALFITASYSFHHVMDLKGESCRTDILKQLRMLNPVMICLIEPDSSHYTRQVSERIDALIRHYTNVFDLIDRSNVDPEIRYLIKEMFFGREILDIANINEEERTERHEPAESWLTRLADAGFIPASISKIEESGSSDCQILTENGVFRLQFNRIPMIAVLVHQSESL
jgi:hypothetical protein